MVLFQIIEIVLKDMGKWIYISHHNLNIKEGIFIDVMINPVVKNSPFYPIHF